MSLRIPPLLLAVALMLSPFAEAGEIVKKSYTTTDGKKVSGLVYRSGESRRSHSTYSRSGSTRRLVPFRSSGYTYASGSSLHYRHRGSCRPSRPAVQTTRTNITYNAACPITVGPRHRGGVTVYRRR